MASLLVFKTSKRFVALGYENQSRFTSFVCFKADIAQKKIFFYMAAELLA